MAGRMAYVRKLLDPTRTGRAAQRLEDELRRRIIGQDEAIRQVIEVYQINLAGMSSPGRPIANLLFLGPTGSGKTRLVEAVAESLAGSPRALVKIDCGEFQHSHEIAKLIGSPPGYLGHRETHPLLSQEALSEFHTETFKISLVLFDEIEKGSDALWNLLLGILDRATLTLGDNRRVDFSQCIIFMTSNVGAVEITAMLQPRMGFSSGDTERRHHAGEVDEGLTGRMARAGVEAQRRKFTPEFINRLDKTVVFRPLGAQELRQVLDLELNAVQERIFAVPNLDPFVIAVTGPARDYLLEEGTDLKYGARHLKRAIDRLLVHPLSNLIATSQIAGGDWIRVDFDGVPGRLIFFKDASNAAAAPVRASGMAAGQAVTEGRPEPLGWFRTRSIRH